MRKRRRFTVIEGQKTKSKRPKIQSLILLTLALLVVRIAWPFAHQALAAIFVRTVNAQIGVLEHIVEAPGFIVRQEQVVTAPLTGTLKWLAADGERLAIGAPVATITTAGGTVQTVTMPAAGMVIKKIDGFEGALQPVILEQPAALDVAQLSEAKADLQEVDDGAEVQQGSFIFKSINNYLWYYVAQFKHDAFAALEGKTTVDLRLSLDDSATVRAQIREVIEEEGTVTAVFALQEQLAGCYEERFAEVEIVTQRTRGIVLPTSALRVRGDETGVYVLDQSLVRYRKVEVVTTEAQQVVVHGLPTGIPVIINPVFVKEGQKL
ncbi:MAG TPA: HlyD family efflux transporter periplasmic adaptor subunit [Oscillospiraceae bacterium]|nr:HlyD family efflux transporter periplasmic adaptor subunit [Oscillospiraceae bacterium]